MPSTILQGIFEAIFQAFFEVGCYYVGRVVIAVFSFGRLSCEALTAEKIGPKKRWSGLFNKRGSRTYVTADATAGVGLLFLVVAVGAALLASHLTT